MQKHFFILIVLACFYTTNYAQKVVFLHHSTGGAVFSEGNVSGWISNYNTAHSKNYQVTERAYPDSPYPWDNYPYDFWNLWVNPASTCNVGQPGKECISTIAQNYNVIIFKHCFPGAGVGADEASSSVSSASKTLTNYKLQYRALRAMMDGYPNNKFIVWTLAPLHRNATNVNDAARAKQFVDWVKTAWLTEDGNSHPNIFIYDFWGIVAESNPSPALGKVNCLKYDYEGSHTGDDSHPNTAANQVAGPLFGQFIVNVIETATSAVDILKQDNSPIVFVNQSNRNLTVDMKNKDLGGASFVLIDRNGREICSFKLNEAVTIKGISQLATGVYFYKIESKKGKYTGKLFVSN